jgi:DNA-binding LytR/AlgR family response regulator
LNPSFKKAIHKAQKSSVELMEVNNKQLDNSNYFYINIDRHLIKIDLPSIYLIEANGGYIHIKTRDKNYVVYSALKKIEEKLPDALFLKIHRSYIINIKKIIDIEDTSVLVKKGVLPVSQSKRPELMKLLDLL